MVAAVQGCVNVFHNEVDCFAAVEAGVVGVELCDVCRREDEARAGEALIAAEARQSAALEGYVLEVSFRRGALGEGQS